MKLYFYLNLTSSLPEHNLLPFIAQNSSKQTTRVTLSMVEETQESTQEPTSAAPQAETWDVEQYEAALKHLESLQEQVRSFLPTPKPKLYHKSYRIPSWIICDPRSLRS